MATLISGLPPTAAAAAEPGSADKSVPVSPVSPKAQPLPVMPQHQAGKVTWPSAGSAIVDLSSSANVGGLPVRVSPVIAADGFSHRTSPAPSKVRVEVLARGAAASGGTPMAVKLSRADGGTGPAKVRLEVDYSAFRHAFGGAYAARMEMRLLPECGFGAVSADQVAKGGCAGVWLDSANDFKAGRVSAEIDLNTSLTGLAAAPMSAKQLALSGQENPAAWSATALQPSLVVTLSASGDAKGIGTFSKTDLKESGTWSHSGNSGNFSYTYPLVSPPVPGGLVPDLSMNYSSATVDGQTAAEHIQSGLLGEGWSLAGGGFIESTFRPCSLDTDHSPAWTNLPGDPCFRHENFQLFWSGHSGELVPTGTANLWKVADDDGAKVEYLTTGGAGAHWRVTTADGTQWHFGRQRLPGWITGGRETKSVLSQEVFANHSGEPCFNAAGYTSSHCQMPYRWMLDYVVDADGNSMSFWYNRFDNYSGSAGSGYGTVLYHRDAVLDRIEYGTRAGNEAAVTTPPAMVEFANTERCVTDCGTEAAPNAANWYDTPFDLRCSAQPCNNNLTPSYWTSRRLSKVTTKVWTGTGTTYKPVDEWTLGHSFPGGTDVPTLWLDSITRKGYDAAGASSTMPALTTHGRRDGNRADYNPGASMADPQKYRIDYLDTEAGARIEVSYLPMEAACTWWSGKLESEWPHFNHNAARCFQQYVTNRSGVAGWSWWHKFVVDKVTERDLVGGSPPKETSYTYLMDGTTSNHPLVLWGYTNNVWATPKKAMSAWKGYPTVIITVGAATGTQSKTKRLYYRGLDRDTGLSPAQEFWRTSAVVDSLGGSVVDHFALGGQVREEIVYDGAAEVSKTINTVSVWQTAGGALPLWQTPPERIAYLNRQTNAKTLTKIADGTWRTAETTSAFDTTYGTINQTDDLGQTSPALATDDTCTRYTYNRSTGRSLLWIKGTGGSGIETSAGLSSSIDMTGYREVMSPGDFSGDGKPDLLAISEADGNGYMWPGTGTGGVSTPRVLIGGGWGVFSKMFSTGDVTGDGRVDLLLMTPAGDVWLATNVGGTSTVGGGLVQSGWSWAERIFSPGDVNADGLGDVYARNSIGELWLGLGTGGGHFVGGGMHGNTWNTYDQFAGRGDVTGDGKTDIYTYDPVDTSIWVHHGNGAGGFTGTKTKIGSGWVGRLTMVTPGDLNADAKPDLWTTAPGWITGTVSRTETVGVNCAATAAYPGDLVSDERTYYDGNTSLTSRPIRGLVTKVEKAKSHNGTAATYLATGETAYDKYGRPAWTKDALGNQTDTAYTHNTAGLVTSTTITAPAAIAGAVRHATTVSFDPLRGKTLTVTDPNSNVTTGSYDPLGQLRKVWQPGNPTSATPDVEYVYSVTKSSWPFIHIRALGPNGNQISTYEMFDGLLRPRQTQKTAPDGMRTISDTQYESRGLAAKVSTFYNAASGPSSTLYNVDATADAAIERQVRYVYDGAERRTYDQLFKMNVKQYETFTKYEGDRVGVIPPTGGTVTLDLLSARGLVTEKRLYLSATAFTGSFDRTLYTYDDAGQLTTMKDPANNQWTYKYDLLGRQYETVDPDAGTSSATFDDVGNVLSTTDGRLQKIYFEYDNLGRKTKKLADTAGGTVLAEWVYDTIAKGQLTSTRRHDGSDIYISAVGSYDASYRPLTLTQTVPGFGAAGGALTYTATNTYRANGALATEVFPSVGGLPTETVTHTYTDQGFAQKMTSGEATYVNDTAYHYDGLVHRQFLGVAGKQARITTDFDVSSRRLSKLWISTENPATPNSFYVPYDYTYGYDAAGNITSVAGNVHGVADQEECLRYDHLRRLKEAWTQTSGTCTTPQRTGADPYWRKWTFDSIGNRLTQQDVDAVAGNTDWIYTVGSAGGVKPHQVQRVNATGPRAGVALRSFGYDNAGNTTTRHTESGAAQTLTWDKEGHLATVTEGSAVTSYVYDAQGARLVAKLAAKTTVYLPGGLELEKMTSGGAVLGTRYYSHSGRMIGVRNATGLRWISADHNGTSLVQIDPVTLVATRRRTMPYGEARGTQPTFAGTKGFAGGNADNTGLVHLGAREYDPSLGRFISRDPLVDLNSPQQGHGYSYGNNSPVTMRDSSGLKPECGNDPGECNNPPPPQTPPAGAPCPGHPACPPPNPGNGGPPCGSCPPPPGAPCNGDCNGRPAPSQGDPSLANQGGSPPPAQEQKKEGNQLAAQIGYWAGKIADLLSFIPSFLCPACALIALLFGIASAIAYVVANQWDNAIAAAIGAGIGALLGKAGAAAVKTLLVKYGGKMLHLARHAKSEAGRVLKYVPSSMRAQIEWVMTGITGLISTAWDAVTSRQTEYVYNNGRPWEGLCRVDCGGIGK